MSTELKTPSTRFKAAEHMDWFQVVLNGGPPCFHICDDGKFCGRALQWEGHDDMHKFISLADLVRQLETENIQIRQELEEKTLAAKLWQNIAEGLSAERDQLKQQLSELLADKERLLEAATQFQDFDKENQVPVCHCCGMELEQSGKGHKENCLADLILDSARQKGEQK